MGLSTNSLSMCWKHARRGEDTHTTRRALGRRNAENSTGALADATTRTWDHRS